MHTAPKRSDAEYSATGFAAPGKGGKNEGRGRGGEAASNDALRAIDSKIWVLIWQMSGEE